MYGQDGHQNYVYVDNLRSKEEEDEDSNDFDDDPEGLVLNREDRLDEGLKMSLQSLKGEKRKNEEDEMMEDPAVREQREKMMVSRIHLTRRRMKDIMTTLLNPIQSTRQERTRLTRHFQLC